MAVYDNVKAICSEKNISILKMESELGFARSSICKWNKNEPGITKIAKVAKYLNVKIEDLIKE